MAPNGLTELKEGSTAPLRLNDFPVGNDVGIDLGVSDGVGGASVGGARDSGASCLLYTSDAADD